MSGACLLYRVCESFSLGETVEISKQAVHYRQGSLTLENKILLVAIHPTGALTQ